MTQEETITLIEIISASYPNAKGFSDEQSCAKTVRVWSSLLGDLPCTVALKAVERHCMTNKWPPSIAEIRESAAVNQEPMIQKTAAEAWGEVIKAVRMFGYYREEEALASLPEQTRIVAKTMGWKDICTCEEPDVIRGQFRRAYESMAIRQKEDAVLPEGFREKAMQIGSRYNPLVQEIIDAVVNIPVGVESISSDPLKCSAYYRKGV